MSEIEENARNFAEPNSKVGIRAMGYNLAALSLTKTGLKARLREIKNQTLIVWGKQDRLLHINCGYEARTYLPHAKFQVYEECGHLPQLEKAVEFNKLVLDFLAE
jgi:pimeloyl-ACP methyl ester carboxylesterase